MQIIIMSLEKIIKNHKLIYDNLYLNLACKQGKDIANLIINLEILEIL